MAALIRHVFLKSVPVLHLSRPVTGTLFIVCRRNLYSDAVLGIDNYVEHRKRIALQFQEMQEKFKDRMKSFISTETHSMVFTEDLKNMVHLTENNPEELKLLTDMIKKFAKQNKELRFGTYIFGPVIMRMCHHLNAVELAYQLIKDPELAEFFNQVVSHWVVLNLLYKNERYDEVIEIFKLIRAQQSSSNRTPRDALVLLFAACYKLNTTESFKVVVQALQDAKISGALVIRKGIVFAAALALKQNDLQMALEILNLTNQMSYFTVKNLKLLILTRMNRFDDVIRLLKSSLNRDIASPMAQERKQEYTTHVIAIVKEAVANTGNKEMIAELDRIEQGLKENSLLNDQPLDEAICSPVMFRSQPRVDQNSRIQGYESRFFLDESQTRNTRGRFAGGDRRAGFGDVNRRGLRDYDE